MALLTDTTAIHRRTDGVVSVDGPDRVAYLHSLLSQDIEGLSAGDVANFLYLDAKGDPLSVGLVVVHAERLLLVVPAEVAADTASRLDRFRFMMQVEIADRSADWAVASIRGDGQVDAAGARSQPMTAAPHGEGMVVRLRDGGVDLIGPVDWVDGHVADYLADGMPEADATDWARWRIAAGQPAWGPEITAGRRSQELGLLPTHVHLQKGCYPGQESIAKIYNLGRPRRALAVVHGDGPLQPGDAVGEGRRPGEVTSVAADDTGTVALALVPLDKDGSLPTELATAQGTVTVRQMVGAGLPQPGGRDPGQPTRPRISR